MAEATPPWIKSTFCANSSCVEVASDGDRIFIRDGKAPQQSPLQVSRADWYSFLDRVRTDSAL